MLNASNLSSPHVRQMVTIGESLPNETKLGKVGGCCNLVHHETAQTKPWGCTCTSHRSPKRMFGNKSQKNNIADMGVSKNSGTPKWMVYGNPIKIDDLVSRFTWQLDPPLFQHRKTGTSLPPAAKEALDLREGLLEGSNSTDFRKVFTKVTSPDV